jgi:glycosyltransferase involved in cell wall biosynthesis
MASADVFVLPSLSEGLPLVVVEAMAMGLPVIANRVGGLPWIIREGENGFLVEPRNPRDIAEKITLLLTNDNLRAYMSKRNIEEARKYSWEKIVENLEKVYMHITSRNHNSGRRQDLNELDRGLLFLFLRQ